MSHGRKTMKETEEEEGTKLWEEKRQIKRLGFQMTHLKWKCLKKKKKM
jgi:hypothetical protein